MKTTGVILKKAFRGWLENPILSMPFLFTLLALLAIIAGILFLLLPTMPTLSTLSAVSELTSEKADLAAIISLLPILLITLPLAGILILAVTSFFTSGAIGMCIEVARGKKISLTDMLAYGKKFWLRFLGLSIVLLLLGLGALTVIFIIFLPLMLLSNYFDVIPALLFLAIFFVSVFLVLPPYVLIIKNTSLTESIKSGFILAKQNFVSILLIIVVFAVIGYVLKLIPVAGPLINFLIVSPIQVLALTLLVLLITKNNKKT